MEGVAQRLYSCVRFKHITRARQALDKLSWGANGVNRAMHMYIRSCSPGRRGSQLNEDRNNHVSRSGVETGLDSCSQSSALVFDFDFARIWACLVVNYALCKTRQEAKGQE
jgi:hypothetical protein